MSGRSTKLRGALYILGGACTFVAANIFLPNDWRAWTAFWCGLIGNTCILWRAYLDGSHAKFRADKLNPELEPIAPEETKTS